MLEQRHFAGNTRAALRWPVAMQPPAVLVLSSRISFRPVGDQTLLRCRICGALEQVASSPKRSVAIFAQAFAQTHRTCRFSGFATVPERDLETPRLA